MNAIVMGRKTWDSIPKKPLPKRFHIILTKNPDLIDLSEKKYENCIALSSTDEVDRFCLEKISLILGLLVDKVYMKNI